MRHKQNLLKSSLETSINSLEMGYRVYWNIQENKELTDDENRIKAIESGRQNITDPVHHKLINQVAFGPCFGEQLLAERNAKYYGALIRLETRKMSCDEYDSFYQEFFGRAS